MAGHRDAVVVVTGGASGIGRATAKAFAAEGAAVVLVDRDDASAAADDIRALGAEVRTERVDVSDAAAMEILAANVIAWKGHVDILVNNAGVAVHGNPEDHTLEDWRWIMGVNLWGVIHGVHAFLPHLLSRGSGHIVNVASGAGLTATPGMAAYCTTKFGVVGFTEALRADLCHRGIGVSVVCPGLVRTSITRRARDTGRPMDRTVLDRYGRDPAGLAKKIVRGVRKNRAVIAYGSEVHGNYALKRFLPWIYDRLLRWTGTRVEAIRAGDLPLLRPRNSLPTRAPAEDTP